MQDPNWRDIDPDFDTPTALERKLARQPWYIFKRYREYQQAAGRSINETVRSIVYCGRLPGLSIKERYRATARAVRHATYYANVLRDDLYAPLDNSE